MSRNNVTEFLRRWEQETSPDVAEVVPLVYEELRRIARHHLRAERADHTLQTTALVHEAYLRLVDQSRVAWRGRNHFLAVASLAMRRLLVDHARARCRAKRGNGVAVLTLTAALPVASDERAEEILVVDDLLGNLEAFDARAARVVECRFYGGLSIADTAAALGLSPMTVKRSWQIARAWLRREIEGRSGS
jgi:RNA polymerase sigma factor (TIGR02999 family)